MAKRYAFWRMPNGKPYKKEDNKFAPTDLLAEHGKSASVVDGGIQWPITGPPRTELAVRSSIVVIDPDDRELNEDDSWVIVRTAIDKLIREKGGKTPIIPNELTKQADREAAIHFRKKPNNYVLVTSLSISEFPAKRISIDTAGEFARVFTGVVARICAPSMMHVEFRA